MPSEEALERYRIADLKNYYKRQKKKKQREFERRLAVLCWIREELYKLDKLEKEYPRPLLEKIVKENKPKRPPGRPRLHKQKASPPHKEDRPDFYKRQIEMFTRIIRIRGIRRKHEKEME